MKFIFFTFRIAIAHKKALQLYFFLSLALLAASGAYGQSDEGVAQIIIEKIKSLESQKDAKCYATANRLEDFMYGTPLNDAARNTRIDIQKELVYNVKLKGSAIAADQNRDSIYLQHVGNVLDNLFVYGTLQSGDWFVRVGDEVIKITSKDLRQYGSVSYAYRSFLSVEQDLIFLPQNKMLPFAEETIEPFYTVINLITLASLQLADRIARENNNNYVGKEEIIAAWLKILGAKNYQDSGFEAYPQLSFQESEADNQVVQNIIAQKLASYEAYNQVNTAVFLRNIQVYFAKQRWPVEPTTSDALKSHLMEALIYFGKLTVLNSEIEAQIAGNVLIRVSDVQKALHKLLPFSVNQFEDVCFFPNLPDEGITIESYDLDAFRDSGWHWLLLKYSLEDIQSSLELQLDPNAAELVVEGLAQMGVLLLRLAGQHSRALNKEILDISDINNAIKTIEDINSRYPGKPLIEQKSADIISSKKEQGITPENGFVEQSESLGLEFVHKSSDWLNRLIRSYVYSEESNTAKLSIPPAFGGAGVAAEDFNNDNLIDLLLLGGFGNQFYFNTGEAFRKDEKLSGALSVWDEQLNSYGEARQPIIADFDNDGYKDIFISYVNAQNKIYRNEGGLSVTDMSAKANLGGLEQVAGPATALDFDKDGLLDIFIGYFGNYVKGKLPTLSRNNQNGDPNKLYRNLGNFVFEEVPFSESEEGNNGWTQALGHTDLNQDGWQDIVVGNDFGINEYYINNGEGKFTEMSKKLGTDKPSYTMNVGIADLNKDQFPDLYISNIVVMQKDEKYVSPNEDTEMKFDPEKMANIRTVEANDLFLSQAEDNSLHRYKLSMDVGRGFASTGWSWDADFFDYDNDGDDDLYCLNGMNDFSVYGTENPFYYSEADASKSVVYASSNKEKNVLFVNDDGKLTNQADKLGLDLLSNARSAAYLDFDNDGDLDIIINNYHDKAQLLVNQSENNNRWIKLKLIGDPNAKINKDAIGSTILLNSDSNNNLWREIHSTDGYLSCHPKVQHFGTGSDSEVNIIIKWSDGVLVTLDKLETNCQYTVKYPDMLQKETGQ